MSNAVDVRHETGIQWTHVPGYIGASWNPTTGCSRVSPGCEHCYAFELHDQRHKANRDAARALLIGSDELAREPGETDAQLARRAGYKLPVAPQYDVPFSTVQLLDERRLTEPLRARKPRCYFVDSMADLFHEDVPAEFIDRVFAVMSLSPQHLFLILTKRPERINAYIGDDRREERISDVIWDVPWKMPSEVRVAAGRDRVYGGWPLPNVWLGVSVEDQQRADERIPLLLDTPAAVRFLSCEPLLGPVDLMRVPYLVSRYLEPPYDDRIDWVIVGGESGRHARPMDIAWVRSLLEQCRRAGVPFFMKQMGSRPMLPITAAGQDEWIAGANKGTWSTRSFARAKDGARLGFALKLRHSHGGNPEEWPEDLRVREWPEVRS
jgi:protein gp37